eukprot:g1163.t1
MLQQQSDSNLPEGKRKGKKKPRERPSSVMTESPRKKHCMERGTPEVTKEMDQMNLPDGSFEPNTTPMSIHSRDT